MINAPLHTIVVAASGAVTASGNSGAVLIQPGLPVQVLTFEVAVTAASGTTPTLDLYLQESLDGGTTFVDLAHLAQITAALTNPTRVSFAARELTQASDAIHAGVGDATTSAGQLSGLPLVSNVVRAKWVVGGTTPSFTMAVTAYA